MTSQPPSFPFQVKDFLVFFQVNTFILLRYPHIKSWFPRWSVGKRITNKWKQYGVLFAYHKFIGPPSAGLSLLQHPSIAPKPHLTSLVRSLESFRF